MWHLICVVITFCWSLFPSLYFLFSSIFSPFFKWRFICNSSSLSLFLHPLIGNALVVIVVLCNPQMRSTTNLLIINLAVADLLFIGKYVYPYMGSCFCLFLDSHLILDLFSLLFWENKWNCRHNLINLINRLAVTSSERQSINSHEYTIQIHEKVIPFPYF